MKCHPIVAIVLGVLLSCQVASIAQSSDSLQAPSPVIEAWKDMRLGMFLCWGPVTLTGKEIGWSRSAPPYGKQRGLRAAFQPQDKTTPTEVYDSLYREWKPDQFDAEQWVAVAKAAGMKYLIFLVKHHDGFCLYDSKLTEHKSTGIASAWKVDVLRQVADACHKHDLKLIIYYSQPDWHHPDFLGEHHQRYVKYLHGQVRELLTRYGRIDGLWFDNLRPVSPETARLWDAERLFQMARTLQPHLIINNRCGLPGDFDTPEQYIGRFQADRPWESCCTLGTQWSWKTDDALKSFEECIRMLVGCAVGDGNLALNTNPMPDGRIEPRQVERFRQIGHWMAKYGDSIYGTRGGPFVAHGAPQSGWKTDTDNTLPPNRWWGGSTRRGNIAYLHVLHWPNEGLTLPDIDRQLVIASVVTGGHVIVERQPGRVQLLVAPSDRDPLDTIIKLEFDRDLADVKPIPMGTGPLPDGWRATASGIWPDPYLGPELAFDGDPGTRWGAEPGATTGWLALDLGKPVTVHGAVIEEGAWNRVRRFELQYQVDGQWTSIASGTSLGPRKVLQFPSTTARQFRLNILEATDVPTIWEVRFFAKEE